MAISAGVTTAVAGLLRESPGLGFNALEIWIALVMYNFCPAVAEPTPQLEERV